MAEPSVAVERCIPFCPRCGWQLPVPEDLDHADAKPLIAWIAVRCAGCEWTGHAKFWTRQADVPS